MLELSDFIHQIYLTEIYKVFYPNTEEYAFYSSVQGVFQK